MHAVAYIYRIPLLIRRWVKAIIRPSCMVSRSTIAGLIISHASIAALREKEMALDQIDISTLLNVP